MIFFGGRMQPTAVRRVVRGASASFVTVAAGVAVNVATGSPLHLGSPAVWVWIVAAVVVLALPASIELIQERRAAAGVTARKGPRVFICHADTDREAALGIREELLGAGIKPWLAKFDLPVGRNWRQEIDEAVRTADVVLVLLSRNSTSKLSYFHKEIRIALDAADSQPGKRPIIMPLRLEPCSVPGRLTHLQYLDLFEVDGIPRAIEALRKLGADMPKASQRRMPPLAQRIGRALAVALALTALPALGAPTSNQRPLSGPQQSPSSAVSARPLSAAGVDPTDFDLRVAVDWDKMASGNSAAEDQVIRDVNSRLKGMGVADRRAATVETSVCADKPSRWGWAVAAAQQINQILRARSDALAMAKFTGYANFGCSGDDAKIRMVLFNK